MGSLTFGVRAFLVLAFSALGLVSFFALGAAFLAAAAAAGFLSAACDASMSDVYAKSSHPYRCLLGLWLGELDRSRGTLRSVEVA